MESILDSWAIPLSLCVYSSSWVCFCGCIPICHYPLESKSNCVCVCVSGIISNVVWCPSVARLKSYFRAVAWVQLWNGKKLQTQANSCQVIRSHCNREVMNWEREKEGEMNERKKIGSHIKYSKEGGNVDNSKNGRWNDERGEWEMK